MQRFVRTLVLFVCDFATHRHEKVNFYAGFHFLYGRLWFFSWALRVTTTMTTHSIR